MVKIFVGNLDPDQSNKRTYVTSQDLRDLFSAYGELAEVERITGKNFGFVHMMKESEAKQACKNLDQHVLKGKRIHVELSTSKSSSNVVKLYVAGFSKNVTISELRDLFDHHAEVVDCTIIPKEDHPFGFVGIDCSAGLHVAKRVIEILNKSTFQGKQITVSVYKEKNKEEWTDVWGGAGRGGLPPPVSARGMMRPPGPIGIGPGVLGDRPSPFPLMGGPPGGARDHSIMRGHPAFPMGGPGPAFPISGPLRPMGPMDGPRADYLMRGMDTRGGQSAAFPPEVGLRLSMERHNAPEVALSMRPFEPPRGYLDRDAEQTNGRHQEERKVAVRVEESTEKVLSRMEQDLAALIQKEFAKEISNFQQQEEMCDMVITCHGKRFACHRLILMAKSPVMKEKLRRGLTSINVLEFGPPIMERLLTFMYTGLVDVSMTLESLGTLLAAASHFQVRYCEEAVEFGLAKAINVGNAVDTLVFAVESMLTRLRSAAIRFIVEHGREIMSNQQEKMKLKMFPDVMMELFEALTEK